MYLNLETQRLIIRPVTLDDRGFILDLVNTVGWLKYIGDRNIKNEYDAKSYIEKILNLPGFYYSVFEDKDTKIPMGIVTFLHRETQSDPDLGFAILPDYEGHGYALEACRIYLEQILDRKKSQDKIIAITKSDNARSINLIQKLGFQYIGNDVYDSQLFIYMIS